MPKKKEEAPKEPVKKEVKPPVEEPKATTGHVKPTKEELKASLEAFEDTPGEPEVDEEEKKPTPKPEEDLVGEPKVEEEEDSPEEKKRKEEIDYRRKFIASTQENQIISSRNKKVNEALKKASTLPDPTEEELMAEFSDWEDMDPNQQKIAKQSLASTRRLQAITEVSKEFDDMDSWQEEVDKFVEDPQVFIDYPRLEGKEAEFKLFASKPSRIKADFDDTVRAFLYAESEQVRINKPLKKRQMFEAGSGGPSTKGNEGPKKMSMEEAMALKNTDYRKYVQAVRDGKIEPLDLD